MYRAETMTPNTAKTSRESAIPSSILSCPIGCSSDTTHTPPAIRAPAANHAPNSFKAIKGSRQVIAAPILILFWTCRHKATSVAYDLPNSLPGGSGSWGELAGLNAIQLLDVLDNV
ncbi:MAG: hypothetical protein QM767_18135 [Anaeromyxobacter sp.]